MFIKKKKESFVLLPEEKTAPKIPTISPEEALPATVTLLVNDRQAALLAGLESNAALRLGLAYRGEPETAKLYLEQQRQYLLEAEAGTASPPELPPKDSGLPPAEASLGGDIS